MRKSLQLSVVFAALVPACGGNDQIAVEAVSDDGQEVSAQAVSLIQLRGEQLGLDRNDVVRQRSRLVDELGHEHVRFERLYRGLPVHGGDFIVHTQARDGENFSAMLASSIPVSQRPTLTPSEAQAAAQKSLPSSGEYSQAADSRLAVYALDGDSDLALAYEVVSHGTQTDGTPSILHTFIDASSGRVLRAYD